MKNYGWPTGPAIIWLWLARRPFGWPRATGPPGSPTPDMYNIINGIAPSYLKSEISIAGHTSHVTRSGNRACFVPRVNSFAIKSFFYTGIKQWNALPSTTQLLTNLKSCNPLFPQFWDTFTL